MAKSEPCQESAMDATAFVPDPNPIDIPGQISLVTSSPVQEHEFQHSDFTAAKPRTTSHHTVLDTLTPTLTPRSSTPHGEHDNLSDPKLQFFEDEDYPGYEWLRIPKDRNYDLFQVMKASPHDRDISMANVLLHVAKHDGTKACMWAKMDTGADVNLINLSTVKAIFGPERTRKVMRAMTLNEVQFHLVGDNHWVGKHKVLLSFQAGKSKKDFEDVEFVVLEDIDSSLTSKDGVPNVILGYDFLKKSSMVMVDVEYNVDEEQLAEVAGLELIAPMAEHERPGHKTIGPVIKVKTVPGIPRGK